MKKACVVVLGEVGRSPRIRYQALSLAEFMNVHIIGYRGGADPAHPNMKISHMEPYTYCIKPKIVDYLIKSMWQALSLFLFMVSEDRYDYVLCQNPPAIPTLFVCWIYCLFTRAKFIIDWHNYGYSIMALTQGRNSKIVRLAAWIEYYFGRKADYNFCVSEAMKNDLLEKQNIQCKLLYDCPAPAFRPITLDEKHFFITKLSLQYLEFADVEEINRNESVLEATVLTEKNSENVVSLRSDRPGILFSSTSWTDDEDFSILLNALEGYDRAYYKIVLPKLICVITGKGPNKDAYLKIVEEKKFENVKIITPWLEINDYPLMVASADLGVCLHTSSSGLDLPMKIIDMFGCGLPVCAYKYPCLSELVKEGENGYMFESSEELCEQIKTWFKDFPSNIEQNKLNSQFRNNLKTFQQVRWDSNWVSRAKPLFD